MRNLIVKELNLIHGEVYVDIMTGYKKVVVNEDKSTSFEQQLFVQFIDAFDEITVCVTATMDEKFNVWKFTKPYLWAYKDEDETAHSIEAAAMYHELLTAHGFMEALNEEHKDLTVSTLASLVNDELISGNK